MICAVMCKAKKAMVSGDTINCYLRSIASKLPVKVVIDEVFVKGVVEKAYGEFESGKGTSGLQVVAPTMTQCRPPVTVSNDCVTSYEYDAIAD
jgi:hypothetical protein